MGIAEHGATGAPAIANPGQETKMDFHLFSLVSLEAGLNTNAGWRICHASLEMMERAPDSRDARGGPPTFTRENKHLLRAFIKRVS